MNLYNIKHPEEQVNFAQAVRQGLGKDQGLFFRVFDIVQIHCISVNYRVLIKCYSPLIKEGIKAIYCLTELSRAIIIDLTNMNKAFIVL